MPDYEKLIERLREKAKALEEGREEFFADEISDEFLLSAEAISTLLKERDALREALVEARGWLEHWGGDSGALGTVLEKIDATLNEHST